MNSYTITQARQDRTAPYISLLGNYGGIYAKGETYEICPAVSADVLAPAVDFTLTVTDAAGNYVSDINGLVLNGVDPTIGYRIVLSQYGTYTVVYSSVEKNAPRLNPSEKVYEIGVLDDEAPTFEINGKLPETAKKGDTVTLPGVSVRDNISAAENILTYVVVRNPNGRRMLLTGDKFTFGFVGEYEIRYTFADEAGNETVYSFKITVE